MGPATAKTDFHWTKEDEPHQRRKREILEKHGDAIRALMRPEPRTVPIVLALVAIQHYVAVTSVSWSWGWWLAAAYIIGGTINHALFLAVHEITHMLAMQSLWGNRVMACIANLPIGIPYAATFHGYHMEHHKHQGWDQKDTDIPTAFEARLLQNPVTKFLFCFFQILFYALRPMIIHAPIVSTWTYVNVAIQVPYLLYLCQDGVTPWIYLLLSTFFAGCLHPVSGHFLAEHFEFVEGAETYSYYGPLNWLAFNVGYHNEHHDFPNIPWSRLPAVKRIAPEFYDNIPQCKSWPGAVWEFITNPALTGFSRVKRMQVNAKKLS
ncbi:Sphingolipid delta(4)-desaturase DES1-like [Diplonema papillatum]|nr:Sphingolipid delta(4)-desaturase DES1-like [Diplonema papillatum]